MPFDAWGKRNTFLVGERRVACGVSWFPLTRVTPHPVPGLRHRASIKGTSKSQPREGRPRDCRLLCRSPGLLMDSVAVVKLSSHTRELQGGLRAMCFVRIGWVVTGRGVKAVEDVC